MDQKSIEIEKEGKNKEALWLNFDAHPLGKSADPKKITCQYNMK